MNKQQQKTDRLNYIEALRFTDYQAFIREIYSSCREERHSAGFTAFHDPISGAWYNFGGQRLRETTKQEPVKI